MAALQAAAFARPTASATEPTPAVLTTRLRRPRIPSYGQPVIHRRLTSARRAWSRAARVPSGVGAFRPFRRKLKPLGTEGGNPSVTDEVMAEGPPIVPATSVEGGVLGGIAYWNEERQAAVHADLQGDIASDFDSL